VLVVELGYAKAKAIVDRSSSSWDDKIFLITGDQVNSAEISLNG